MHKTFLLPFWRKSRDVFTGWARTSTAELTVAFRTTLWIGVMAFLGIFIFTVQNEVDSTPNSTFPRGTAQEPSCDMNAGSAVPMIVSIAELLVRPDRFHLHYVTVRGRIVQPELHIDETELFLDFVFLLEAQGRRLLVFGRFDRTLGNNPIVTDAMVEITGIFWKERFADQQRFENILEACRISPYPSLVPDAV